VQKFPPIDGRVFVLEPHDCVTSMHHLLRRELSVRDWCRGSYLSDSFSDCPSARA
jgi:hypothetical protein